MPHFHPFYFAYIRKTNFNEGVLITTLRAFSFYLVPHLTVRFITLVQTLSLVILGVRYYYIHYILYHYVQCCQLYRFDGQKLQPLLE